MRLTHPYAERDTAPPGAVTVDGETYAVSDDGTVEVPDDVAETLVAAWERRFGDHTATTATTATTAADTCDAVMDDGEVCGRELPCQYHSDTEAED